MIRLGIFLIVVGTVVGFGSMAVILGTDEAIPILEPLFCDDNDTLIRETRADFEGEIIDYYCVDDDGGERTNVAGKLFLVIFGLIGILPIGAFMTVFGTMRKTKQEAQENLQKYGVPIQSGGVTVQSDNPLQDKLRQLQEAYDAGLIDRAEYDSRKKLLLDNFVE